MTMVDISGRKVNYEIEIPDEECDCISCLLLWAQRVGSRYIGTPMTIKDIPESSSVLVIDYSPWRQAEVWRRSDYLAHLKHLANHPVLKPHERLTAGSVGPLVRF